MEKLLKNCLLQNLFCSSTIWKEITEVKVLGPRRFQGLLTQSNSSFEGSSRVQLQMTIYIVLPSLTELLGVPCQQLSPHQGEELFPRIPSTFSLACAGFSLQILDMAYEVCCWRETPHCLGDFYLVDSHTLTQRDTQCAAVLYLRKQWTQLGFIYSGIISCDFGTAAPE